MENNEEKAVLDVVLTGCAGALLAAAFQAIKAARSSVGREFDPRQFLCGLISAAGVGALTAWSLESLGVSREISAIIISMAGYTGGALLDVLSNELLAGTRQVAKSTRQKIVKDSRK